MSFDNTRITVYFDIFDNYYITEETASILNIRVDGRNYELDKSGNKYYEVSSSEIDQLDYNIKYQVFQTEKSDNKSNLPTITVFFDDENNYLDRETAIELGFRCDGDYYILYKNEAMDLESKYHLEYRLFMGKKEDVKKNIILYVDDENSVFIDKEFATQYDIKTDISYVELGKGAIEVAKKHFNVLYKDLYTKENLKEDTIKEVELNNLENLKVLSHTFAL